MRPDRLVPLPVAVSGLQKRIEHWRATRTKRGRMPTELWEESARLAHLHGVYAIAKAMRLNYEALKAWVAGSAENDERPAPARKPAFLQLHPSTTVGFSSDSIEVETPGGAKMRIRLAAPSMEDVAALLQAFLQHEHP